MKALGGREAKRRIALAGKCCVEAGDDIYENRDNLARAASRCHHFRGDSFDGHSGVREVYRTVTKNMAAMKADQRVLALLRDHEQSMYAAGSAARGRPRGAAGCDGCLLTVSRSGTGRFR